MASASNPSMYVPPPETSVSTDGYSFRQLKNRLETCKELKRTKKIDLLDYWGNADNLVESIKNFITNSSVEVLAKDSWKVRLYRHAEYGWEKIPSYAMHALNAERNVVDAKKCEKCLRFYEMHDGPQTVTEQVETGHFQRLALRQGPYFTRTSRHPRIEHQYDTLSRMRKEYEGFKSSGRQSEMKEKEDEIKSYLVTLVENYFSPFFQNLSENDKGEKLVACNQMYLKNQIWSIRKPGDVAKITDLPVELWMEIKERLSLDEIDSAAEASRALKAAMHPVPVKVCANAIKKSDPESEAFQYMCGTRENPRGPGLKRCANPEKAFGECRKIFDAMRWLPCYLCRNKVYSDDPNNAAGLWADYVQKCDDCDLIVCDYCSTTYDGATYCRMCDPHRVDEWNPDEELDELD